MIPPPNHPPPSARSLLRCSGEEKGGGNVALLVSILPEPLLSVSGLGTVALLYLQSLLSGILQLEEGAFVVLERLLLVLRLCGA